MSPRKKGKHKLLAIEHPPHSYTCHANNPLLYITASLYQLVYFAATPTPHNDLALQIVSYLVLCV